MSITYLLPIAQVDAVMKANGVWNTRCVPVLVGRFLSTWISPNVVWVWFIKHLGLLEFLQGNMKSSFGFDVQELGALG